MYSNPQVSLAEMLERLKAALADRYTLERELGRGGMATVYLAFDRKHDRRVALKVLHPELAASVGPERFLCEIRLTAQLDHSHILPVHDSGEAAGTLWYTMPYVEGESLRDRLRRQIQLPVEETVRLAREVADALDCAQSQLVHERTASATPHRQATHEHRKLPGSGALLGERELPVRRLAAGPRCRRVPACANC